MWRKKKFAQDFCGFVYPKSFWGTKFVLTKHFFGRATKKFFPQKLNLNFWGTKYLTTNEVKIFYLNPQTKMHLRMEFDSGVGPTCFIIFMSETS